MPRVPGVETVVNTATPNNKAETPKEATAPDTGNPVANTPPEDQDPKLTGLFSLLLDKDVKEELKTIYDCRAKVEFSNRISTTRTTIPQGTVNSDRKMAWENIEEESEGLESADESSSEPEQPKQPKQQVISHRTATRKAKIGPVDLTAKPPDDNTIIELANNKMFHSERHQKAPMVWDDRGPMKASFHYLLDRNDEAHFWDNTQVKTMINEKEPEAFFRFRRAKGLFNAKGRPRRRR
ncbi:MAG: hypothetical protein Q9221_008804 [Calogaya cf. arnoldii]